MQNSHSQASKILWNILCFWYIDNAKEKKGGCEILLFFLKMLLLFAEGNDESKMVLLSMCKIYDKQKV